MGNKTAKKADLAKEYTLQEKLGTYVPPPAPPNLQRELRRRAQGRAQEEQARGGREDHQEEEPLPGRARAAPRRGGHPQADRPSQHRSVRRPLRLRHAYVPGAGAVCAYAAQLTRRLTGGELFDRIVAKGNYTEKDASIVTRDLTRAIAYLHGKNIAHRDLKPENLIYQSHAEDSLIKLTDFGLAKVLGNGSLMTTACGTPGYVAPEILKNERYGAEVDMWSVGVILYILLCGFPPFYDESAAGLYDQIKRGDYDFPDPYWTDVSGAAKDCVSKLLNVDRKNRLTAEQLLEHPWICGEGVASTNPLGPQYQKKLREFNARRKLRKAVNFILAMNRLSRMVGDLPTLEDVEGDVENIQ